jgi:hypothetical protein
VKTCGEYAGWGEIDRSGGNRGEDASKQEIRIVRHKKRNLETDLSRNLNLKHPSATLREGLIGNH